MQLFHEQERRQAIKCINTFLRTASSFLHISLSVSRTEALPRHTYREHIYLRSQHRSYLEEMGEELIQHGLEIEEQRRLCSGTKRRLFSEIHGIDRLNGNFVQNMLQETLLATKYQPRRPESPITAGNPQSETSTVFNTEGDEARDTPLLRPSRSSLNPPSIIITTPNNTTEEPQSSLARIRMKVQEDIEDHNHLSVNKAWQQIARREHKNNVYLERDIDRLRMQNEVLRSMIMEMSRAFDEMDQEEQVAIHVKLQRLEELEFRILNRQSGPSLKRNG